MAELLLPMPSGVESRPSGASYGPTWPSPVPMTQFQGEQHPERHGGVLTWPGHPGYRIPIWSEDDSSHVHSIVASNEALGQMMVYLSHQYARVFDLTQTEDIEYYTWIQRRIRANWFFLDSREMLQPEGARVLLEWTQVYFQIPKDQQQAAPPVGSLDYAQLPRTMDTSTTRVLD